MTSIILYLCIFQHLSPRNKDTLLTNPTSTLDFEIYALAPCGLDLCVPVRQGLLTFFFVLIPHSHHLNA